MKTARIALVSALGALAFAGAAAAQTTTQPAHSPYMTDAEFNAAYTAMDKNGDGFVSRDEYMNYYGTRYDQYDTARKGTLDRKTVRDRLFERELRKTDGNVLGNSPDPKVPVKR